MVPPFTFNMATPGMRMLPIKEVIRAREGI